MEERIVGGQKMQVLTLEPMEDSKTQEIAKSMGAVDEGDTMALMAGLSRGNPGAAVVLGQVAKAGRRDLLLKLEENRMIGPAIWVGYKDYCGQKIEAYLKALEMWDPSMLAVIEEETDWRRNSKDLKSNGLL